MSPFPGVDPYLESQRYWEDFHTRFTVLASEMLADRLPGHYEARIEERISLVFRPGPDEAQEYRPDVSVLRRPSVRVEAREVEVGVLTIEPVTIPFLDLRFEPTLEHRIEIRRRPGRALVTAIELLSPSNKREPGKAAYLRKRLELIHQPVNLVEVDLLLGGDRLPMGTDLPPGDFYAFVSRGDRRPNSDVFAWTLRRPIPSIPIPLERPDPDVVLDLAALFAAVYVRGRYAGSIDYATSLTVPMDSEDRAWAEGLARAETR